MTLSEGSIRAGAGGHDGTEGISEKAAERHDFRGKGSGQKERGWVYMIPFGGPQRGPRSTPFFM